MIHKDILLSEILVCMFKRELASSQTFIDEMNCTAGMHTGPLKTSGPSLKLNSCCNQSEVYVCLFCMHVRV